MDADEGPDRSAASGDSIAVAEAEQCSSSGDDIPSTSAQQDHASPVQARRSALGYLNFVQDCKRRFGKMYNRQKLVNTAVQQWRSMDEAQRNQYRNPDYRQKNAKRSQLLESSSGEDDSTASMGGLSKDFLTLPGSDITVKTGDCDMKPKSRAMSKRKRSRSCATSKHMKSSSAKRRRKKSSSAKRRRKMSACKKSKRKMSRKPKSCGTSRRKSRSVKRKKTC
ncbi:histone-like protein 18C [Drosophila madeirensis]